MKRKAVIYLLASTMVMTSLSGCGAKRTDSETSSASYEATCDASYEATYATECVEAEAPCAASYDATYEECEGSYDYEYEAPAEAVCAEASSASTNGACDTVGSSDSTSIASDESYVYESAKAAPALASKSSANNSSSTKSTTDSYLDSVYDMDTQENRKLESTENEEYTDLEELGFKNAQRNPVSTFAADVDTASYSNMRRLFSYGYNYDELPENSVRIEELVNYFNYDYQGPKGSEPFGVNTVLGDCPWNRRAKLLSIGLKTEDIDFSKAPSSNLVFLIDVSGSMYDEDKLPLLQDAFCMLADQLDAKDRVSIVTYAGEDTVVLEGVKGSEHRKIKNAIRNLEASGCTNGGRGIKTAYELAEDYFIKGGNNRVILATDGDLNVGVTSVSDLEDLISEEKETGVFLSVLGFGSGNIKDNRMEALADKGNGNYAFIDSEREAKKVLVTELTANMLTVCKDVKFQVEFNSDVVDKYRLIGYTNRAMSNRDFDDDTKDGGEIGAGHTVTALYEIVLADDFSDKDRILDLNVRFKRPAADESELLTYVVKGSAYDNHPSDDFMFQSAVAEFGLLASKSEYTGRSSIEDVYDILSEIDLNDEYKEEFLDMVSEQM